MKINKVAVVSKFGSIKAENAAKGIAEKLLKQKFEVYTISPVLVNGAKKVDSLEDLKKIKLDLVITLGGDGTTLRTFRNLENETPLLTINVGGNRGILSEINLGEIDNAIQHIMKNEIWLDKRTRVIASCNGEQFQPALNEIYVNRKNLTKTAEFEIKFQNDTVKQKMDGVMISTPSGSTGHSLSIGEPTVTIHLPIYNEKYVTKRLLDSVCDLDYPKEKMSIMVLDDSDDNTTKQIAGLVQDYKGKGFDISHVRRGTREGYKAGALKYAMKHTKSEFVAIFDADFIPPKWYLKRTIPYFTKPNIGLVQCRWGHVNENYSALTQAQALSLDFHFLIEQRAKSNSHLFMNFNGTAGIWRKECIDDSGGWHTATLVEDLDLSYRAQMKGWKCLFIPDIVVNAELPVQMNGAKRQQFRWAKGSIQCAIKLLGSILIKRKIAFDAKLQAFVQLTRHIVFPLMLIQFLTLPILLASNVNLYIVSFLPVVTLATYFAMGPGAYLFIIHSMYDKNRKDKAIAMPYLIIYSMGMAVNNTIAVIDAMVGKKSEFLRTPKYGIVNNTDDWRTKAYNLPFSKTTLLELFFGIYGILAIFIAFYSRNPIWIPIIALQTAGFLYIAFLSFSHTRFKRGDSKIVYTKTKEEKMTDIIHKLAVSCIIAIICFGAYMGFAGYQSDVYPMDLSIGLFDRIMASSEPKTIIADINAIKEHLPTVGNPVWIFPTDTTNFTRIQADLDVMLASAEKISGVPRDSSAFHTGMMDLSLRAEILQKQMMDMVPYMYASVTNILFSCVWIAAIIGVFTILKKKKQSLEAFDKSKGV